MSETRIEQIRELDRRISELGRALSAAKSERLILGRQECLERKENLHGRRVRDPKGRVFELLLREADVEFRDNGTRVVCRGPRYAQIQIRKDGGHSLMGEQYCRSLGFDGKPRDGWSWAEETPEADTGGGREER